MKRRDTITTKGRVRAFDVYGNLKEKDTEKSDMKNGPDCESELKAVESTKDETGLDLEVNKGIKVRKIVMEDGKIIYALPTIEIPYQNFKANPVDRSYLDDKS